MSEQEKVSRVVDAIRSHPAINELKLVGSRSDGTATLLSDWDFKVETRKPERVFDELSAVVAQFEPLAAFWDPLGERRNFMAIFAGPLKLDIHLDMPPLEVRPWEVASTSIQALDAHFWDWTLWLAGKALKDQDELIARELLKMHAFILAPLGRDKPARTIKDAVGDYRAMRATVESDLGTRVAGNALEREVLAALEQHGILK